MTPHTTPSAREKITVLGGQLLAHAQQLLHEGNMRRMVLSGPDDCRVPAHPGGGGRSWPRCSPLWAPWRPW